MVLSIGTNRIVAFLQLCSYTRIIRVVHIELQFCFLHFLLIDVYMYCFVWICLCICPIKQSLSICPSDLPQIACVRDERRYTAESAYRGKQLQQMGSWANGKNPQGCEQPLLVDNGP